MEVIVAMVLLSTTGLALMAWINQSLETGSRLQARLDEAALLRQSSAWLATMDLSRDEQGELEREGLRLRWRAHALGPTVPNAGFEAQGKGPWRLTLYEVAVEVQMPGQTSGLKYSTLVLSKTRS